MCPACITAVTQAIANASPAAAAAAFVIAAVRTHPKGGNHDRTENRIPR